MKESKAVYVNKHKIRDDQNLVYHLYKTTREDMSRRLENRSNFGAQYDSKRDNVLCTCKNTAVRKRRHDYKYFSGMPKQIFACQESRRLVDIGVGSVKTIQRRRVKRIYLPETDDTGVGSSDLSSFILWRRYPKIITINSFYDNKKTSSKCVGGIMEYNTGCVINQKLSPIIQTKSGCTSPKRSLVAKRNTDTGNNTVDNKLETTGTQFEVVETEKLAVKPENPEVKSNIAIGQAEKKAPTKVSEQTQKNKYSNDVIDDKKISQTDKKAKEIEPVRTYSSSDSLVQHVHNLENPSSEKHSRTSFPDPMENKLEREYRKMFSTTKSKESKPSCDKPIPEFKSTSILRRRFEALRRGINKKESSSKKRDSVVMKTSVKETPLHKDASVTSDPPSLISRSFSDTAKYLAAIEKTKREKNKNAIKKEKRSLEWQPNSVDSESPGVKGMFKLWGKKFNFEEDGNGKRQATPMSSYDSNRQKKKNRKEEQPKVEATQNKKEGKKFFFFKKKSKDTNKSDCIPKKDVTAGRCEIKDGIMLKIADVGQLKEKPKVSEESNEITRKAWMRRFISEAMESARSVNIRWNNSLYASSSSTVFELLDSVYKNTNVVLSQSDITGESSYFKSFTKQVNFVQDIEAWMIPKTIPDNPVKQILTKEMPVRQIPIRQTPLHFNSEKNINKKSLECTQSDHKWYIEKSEAFSHKIEVVLHSNNATNMCDKKASSEYLRIDIPGDFFDTSSDERDQNHSSDEKVYKIVEYETNSEIGRARKANELQKEDNVSKDINVVVRVKDSRSLETKILETIIKRPPVHKDVVIQGTDVADTQRCDVIGVGIITQRDLRELRKPILKIRDNVTDDDSEPALQLNQKKCEFAESYLQEYYRHWTPLGVEAYPWCVSDSHVPSSSEKSFASIHNVADGSKSCPNIYEDLEPTIVTSCETSAKPCKRCTYKELINEKLYNEMMKKLIKPVKAKTESNLAKKNQRILPKDSLEVFKRRKVNEMSCRAQWAKYCADVKDVICSVPSVQSKCCSSADMEYPNKDKPAKPKTNLSKKRGLGHMNTNDQLCRKPIEGILSFKTSMCDTSGSGKSKCQKHAVVNPIPSCEIPQPPCKKICNLMPSPGCNKPNSPSCNTAKPNENACPEAIPICSKPKLPPEISLPPDRCPPHQPPCKFPICPSNLPACKLLPLCKRPKMTKKDSKKVSPCKKASCCKKLSSCEPTPCYKKMSPCEPQPCCKKPPPCKTPSPCPTAPPCPSPPPCMSPSPCPSPPPCPSSHPCPSPPLRMPPSCCPPPSCASPPPCPPPPSCPSPPPCPSSLPCPSSPRCPTPSCKSFCKSDAPCKKKSSILQRKTSTGSCCKNTSSLSSKCTIPSCSKCSPIPSLLPWKKSKSQPCKTPPCKSPPCKSLPCESPSCKSPPCKNNSSPIDFILKWKKSNKSCKTCKRKYCGFTNKKDHSCCHNPSYNNCNNCCKSTSSSCRSTSSCRRSPCAQSPCGSPKPPCGSPKPKPLRSPKPKPTCCLPKSQPPCGSPKPQRPCDSPKQLPCDSPKQSPCNSTKQLPYDSPKQSSCDIPKRSPCDSPKESPCDSPDESPCGSSKKLSSPCMSKPGLSLKKPPTPPCPPTPPKPPKKKLCNLPPCDTIKLPPPPKCKEEKKKKPMCDEEFPWPTKNQVSNPPSPTCNSPQPKKLDCNKDCIMKKTEPECPPSKTSPSPSNTSCFPDPACFPELPCSPKPSKPSCTPPKPPCPLPKLPCPPPKQPCLPPKSSSPPPKPPCPPPKPSSPLNPPCPPSKPSSTPPKPRCLSPKPSCPPPKPPSPPPKPLCPSKPTCPPDPCAPRPLPYTPPHCTKSKIAGLFLKMKPAPKKVCDDDCATWNGTGQKEEELQLRSNKNLSIRIKDTCSTDEIRNQMNIKVQDEDGATLYERRDYTCGNQHEAVLGDLYKESKITRVTTPLTVTNMVEDNDTKPLTSYISDKSLVNALEINFKLCITQGDKTAEIDIGGNDGDEKRNGRTDLNKSTPEVFIVNSGRAEPVGESPKNDINIKITLRNFKPKPKHKITKDKKRTDDFSKKISDKFHTVSTGYSDVEEENAFSIHRATINLASSADVSHISSKMHEKVPNCADSSYSIDTVTEDENIEEFSSKTDVKNQNVKENLTNEPVLHTFNETDTEEDTDPMLMGINTCKCNDDSVKSKIDFKEQKKALLKKVFQKAGKRSKNKENVRELRDMLKIILTDSSEIDETNVSSNTLAKDVTYTSLKPNYFKDTDSMNNYYQIESNISSMNESKINAICPTAEANSRTSSDTEDNDMTFRGCMCTKVAERLNQANANKIGCCCRQNYKKDQETNCDIRNAADYFLLNYQTTEYIDVETQNSRRLTSKVNSYNVSIHSSIKKKSMSNTYKDIKVVEEITTIKSPHHGSSRRSTQGESVSLKSGAETDDTVEEIKVIKSPVSHKVSKNISHRTDIDAEAERQDVYQNSTAENNGDQVSTRLTELSVEETKKNSKRSVKCDEPQVTDILQSYATKKAVLEIYAEKTENSDNFVAKLPKFVVEKESEIVKNFEEIAKSSYKSVCKENVFIMSVKR